MLLGRYKTGGARGGLGWQLAAIRPKTVRRQSGLKGPTEWLVGGWRAVAAGCWVSRPTAPLAAGLYAHR